MNGFKMSELSASLFLLVLLFASPLAPCKLVELDAALGTPYLLAGEKQTAFLRVALTGFPMEGKKHRPPVNVAIVLDKSGSMTGEKIEQAKEAALMVMDRLERDDIVSLVAYDSTVRVVVPATRLTDRAAVSSAIRRIQAGGTTALFAGVSKGAAEVREFLAPHRVNRIILLSDGLANVGPSSPGDLAELGASLIKEGISVTTIGLGLGYNEDLMAQLAFNSDGNHLFAESAYDLNNRFNLEFGDVLSVVAQEVDILIDCAQGVRPVRVLNREADIIGRTIRLGMNQLYGNQLKYAVVEIEVPAAPSGTSRTLAEVTVRYRNMETLARDELRSAVSATFTASQALVDRSANKKVMGSVVRQLGAERSKMAMRLRDQGRVEEARQILLDNAAFLDQGFEKYDNEWLRKDATANRQDAENLDPENWKKRRKEMQDWSIFQQLQGLGYLN